MTKHSAFRRSHSAVLIVGGGPAGASLAIRLATRGSLVTLLEKDRFPREKLCGEFVSPECLDHLEELGVRGRLEAVGGDRVIETRFFGSHGASVVVPTAWFGGGDHALSISRAAMDRAILHRAREVGVEVIEGARVLSVRSDGGWLEAVRARMGDGTHREFHADLFVDASGRAAALGRASKRTEARNGLVAFKAHLSGVVPETGACEIFFFQGGYGGLSHIEEGRANICFIVKSDVARRFIGHTNELFHNVVRGNARGRDRMSDARPLHDWLAVSLGDFGFKEYGAAMNVVSIGDAGAFIDPFTGSGMLMALESSSILAECIESCGANPAHTKAVYEARHKEHFKPRLRISRLLRRAAFRPELASMAIFLAGRSEIFRRTLAKATRGHRDHRCKGY